MKDEEVLEEYFNFPLKDTGNIQQHTDMTDTNPDDIFVLGQDYGIAMDDIENIPDDKIEDEKPFMLYRYLVEDRRASGSVTLIRVASVPDSRLMVERERKKKMRRTQTFYKF